MIEELLQIADRIKDLRLELKRLQREHRDLWKKRDELEYRHYTEIYNAVDEKGKLIYTKEDRRRREVEHRLRNDKEAIELNTKSKEFSEKEERISSEIERLQDRKITLLVALGAPIPSNVLEESEDSKYIIYNVTFRILRGAQSLLHNILSLRYLKGEGEIQKKMG